MKRSSDYRKTDSDQVAKKLLQNAGQMNCKFCPPWENDNRVGKASLRGKKHGTKKPKYKNKR